MPPRRSKIDRTPEQLEELAGRAAHARANGAGVKRIARELGISQHLATLLLRDVPAPREALRARARDEDRAVALQLRAEGRTYDEIRTELGVSKGVLSLWLRDLPAPTEEQRERVRRGAEAPEPVELPVTDREIARQLRLDGWLLREIAADLGASPGTAFAWTRGLPVPATSTHGRTPDEVRAMGRAYWDRRRPVIEAERAGRIAAAAARIGPIDDATLDIVAAVAYWCEGTKSKPWRRTDRLVLINSDVDVICVWLEWLRRRGVPWERIGLRVNIHESADVAKATQFWAEATGAAGERFSRPTLKRHNPKTVRYNTGDTYVGCLVVSVRQSRLLYQEIEGIWRGVVAGALASSPRPMEEA